MADEPSLAQAPRIIFSRFIAPGLCALAADLITTLLNIHTKLMVVLIAVILYVGAYLIFKAARRLKRARVRRVSSLNPLSDLGRDELLLVICCLGVVVLCSVMYIGYDEHRIIEARTGAMSGQNELEHLGGQLNFSDDPGPFGVHDSYGMAHREIRRVVEVTGGDPKGDAVFCYVPDYAANAYVRAEC